MITIIYDEKGKDMSLQASGHAGYAPKGQDIVCAAVSTLMQSLAYSVDSGTVTCDPGGDNILRVQASRSLDTLAKFELVMDGLYLLAQQYPENVRLINLHANDADNMDLQLFGDGAAAGSSSDGAQASEGESSPVAPPALRPAQERLAKRSRPGKAAKVTTEKNLQPPAGGSPLKEGASGSESDPAEAEKHQEPAKEPKAEKTPEERRRAFGEMVQGEYSDVFQEMMQRAIDKATENIRQNPQVARLTQALANAYGVDTDDMDGLIEAVENGRVKDEKYYEDLAQQRGVSVKTARELDKMESDLKRSNTRNAQLQAMQQEATRQQRVSQIQAQWEAQAAQLKTQYPDFELQEVLANEQVADLMRRGVSLPDAYRAAYFDHIMQQATAQTAQKVEQGVAARIQQRASRPGENGTRPGGAVTTHVDVASMSRRQLEDLERRARRGEKITL